uniref:transposase n=1 Tax=Paenibacillus alginolyticus TaxID=59839 RepID=UPI001FE8FA2F|nr:transposase [Paenibacillus frigoriresistens]
MRMKEDHMRNGQFKPGYNVQIGTENQFILGYSVHQRPTDTRCLIPHLEKVKSQLGKMPGTVIADAGYGGEENYNFLEQNEAIAIVKYSTYHRENSKVWQTDISKIDNWTYNEEQDTWTCAAGQNLVFRRESKGKTESGYEIQHRHYRSTSCEGCPLKPKCTKAEGNREIKVSMKYLRLKNQAREKLRSEEGYTPWKAREMVIGERSGKRPALPVNGILIPRGCFIYKGGRKLCHKIITATACAIASWERRNRTKSLWGNVSLLRGCLRHSLMSIVQG